MDLVQLTNEVTQKIVNEKLAKIVEDQITKTITSIVEDSFKSYSDFGKLVSSKVKESLGVSLDGLKLPDMTGIIMDRVKQSAIVAPSESSLSDLQESITAAIGVMPEEIKLSEIIRQFGISCHEDLSSWWNEDYKTISFYCEENKEHGWWTINIDESEDCPKYKCAYEFLVDSKNSSMFMLVMKEPKSQIKNMVTRSDFDLLLLRLYHSRKTKIIIDENHVETEFNFGSDY